MKGKDLISRRGDVDLIAAGSLGRTLLQIRMKRTEENVLIEVSMVPPLASFIDVYRPKTLAVREGTRHGNERFRKAEGLFLLKLEILGHDGGVHATSISRLRCTKPCIFL